MRVLLTGAFGNVGVSTLEALLRYQTRTLEDYTKDLRKSLGFLRPIIAMFRPLVRKWLLSKSPYLATGGESSL